MRSKLANILVIDDDPLFRSLLSSLLHQSYSVVVASEGSEGFYKAVESPPDLAIIDIQMPGWDGLKTLKAFREHTALCVVKTIILTSDASKETVLAAIYGGADDYLIKSHFSKEELLRKIQSLLPEKPGKGRDAKSLDRLSQQLPKLPVSEPENSESKPALVSNSATIRSPAVSSSDSHVVLGELGTSYDDAQIQKIMDDWE